MGTWGKNDDNTQLANENASMGSIITGSSYTPHDVVNGISGIPIDGLLTVNSGYNYIDSIQDDISSFAGKAIVNGDFPDRIDEIERRVAALEEQYLQNRIHFIKKKDGV